MALESNTTSNSASVKRRNRAVLILAFIKLSLLILVVIVFTLHTAISRSTERRVFSDLEILPNNHVGLLLGTAKYQPGGGLNPYFIHRIDAAVELYEAGKIKYILASGDNEYDSYNEPLQMRQTLLERGVPSEIIILDYAGFSTLDSVVRTAEVFGRESFTVISQRFHNERAVYIGSYYGYDVVGYNAADLTPPSGVQTHVREYLARVKAILDLHVVRRRPRFLGEPVQVPE
ncbi:MAG: YdcF family protein [Spirochaeta sp.]|nr:YdcF family protein [Spirochaeta sp.]